MRILSCASVRRRLDLWHDGQLPPTEQCAVDQHLAGCPPCADDARALQRIGELLRDSAALRVLPAEQADGLRSGLLARRKAEDDLSWTTQVGVLFEDMHLVWAGLSATAATAICVVLLAGIAYLTPAERADSLSGLMSARAQPVSLTGPARYAGDAVPSSMWQATREEDLVLALAAVVTQEGRLAHSDLLLADREDRETVLRLMNAVAAARFQPARLAGAPVAVNVVWRDGPHFRLLEHTTVRGRTHS
jgi:anti-sigma factor RsiW